MKNNFDINDVIDLNVSRDWGDTGFNDAEWNADNFVKDQKVLMRAREIYKENPYITVGEIETRIYALKQAFKKNLFSSNENCAKYNIEIRAYKMVENHIMQEYGMASKLAKKLNLKTNKIVSENMKKQIKLNESQLKKLISKNIKKVLNEYQDYGDMDDMTWNYGESIGDYHEDEPQQNEERKIIHWYDEVEQTYDVVAMIKSEFNPLHRSFKATSIQDAIKQATECFSQYSRYGEKDVDIYYIKHHGYDGV